MGKNKGKHGAKTEYAKFQSIMAKLNNEINKQIAENKKETNSKSKGKKDKSDE